MKRTVFGICVAAWAALASGATADDWTGETPCAAPNYAETAPDGSAANSDSHAEVSVTMDSRGGSDVSVRLGSDAQQERGRFSHPRYNSGGGHCLPNRYHSPN